MDTTLTISWIGFIAAVITALFWPIFLFYTVSRVERGIVSEGKRRPCQWDPMGFRAFFYAWKVSIPLKFLRYLDDGLIDPQDVKRYSNSVDFWLASIFTAASHTMFVVIIVSWAIGM